jgi:hypothetical protein
LTEILRRERRIGVRPNPICRPQRRGSDVPCTLVGQILAMVQPNSVTPTLFLFSFSIFFLFLFHICLFTLHYFSSFSGKLLIFEYFRICVRFKFCLYLKIVQISNLFRFQKKIEI